MKRKKKAEKNSKKFKTNKEVIKSPSPSKHRHASKKIFWLVERCNMRPISRNLLSQKKTETKTKKPKKVVVMKNLNYISIISIISISCDPVLMALCSKQSKIFQMYLKNLTVKKLARFFQNIFNKSKIFDNFFFKKLDNQKNSSTKLDKH